MLECWAELRYTRPKNSSAAEMWLIARRNVNDAATDAVVNIYVRLTVCGTSEDPQDCIYVIVIRCFQYSNAVKS